MLGAVRRHRTIRKWVRALEDGRVDPYDPQVLTPCPGIGYVPVPKAANTSIRIAMLPLFGGSREDLARPSKVHKHPAIARDAASEVLPALEGDAYLFTVVRHPASRLRSAWKNKVSSARTFGPARRLGLGRFTSFPDFLRVIAGVPQGVLDAHFRSQSEHLAPLLGDTRLRVFRSEELGRHWEEIAATLEERSGVRPETLEAFNRTGAGEAARFTEEEQRLINYACRDDLRLFGYGWSPEGLPIQSGPLALERP